MLVPFLFFLTLTLLLLILLTLFILRRPGLGLRLYLARIPHAPRRWGAQIRSRYKKALRPLSLERLSLSLGPLSLESLSLGPLSSRDVAQLEDAGRVGSYNPFDPSPSPSLRDGDCSSCSSSEVLSSPSPPLPSPTPQSLALLHPTISPPSIHSTNPNSPVTEITATPSPQPPRLNPRGTQRVLRHTTQPQAIEPSSTYDIVNLIHHHNNKRGHRAPSPATKHLSPLSWDTQLDKYFYADGAGIRES